MVDSLTLKSFSEFPYNLIDEKSVPVFCSSAYANYLTSSGNEEFIWFTGLSDEKIICIIPFLITKKFIFKRGTFLTSVIILNELNEEDERHFLSLVTDYIKENKICDWIQQPANWAIFRTVPEESIFCEFGTYRIDLQSDEDIKLLKKMHRDHRQHILHATRNDKITIKKGPDLVNDCLRIFSDSAAGKSIDLPAKNDLKKMIFYLAENIQLYVSYYDDEPQSCIVYFTDNNCYYAVFAAMVPNPEEGVNHILHWQAMIDAKCNGVRYYDFVGSRVNPEPRSKYDGLKRFKSHFGGEFVQGYLWKLPLSKLKYYLCCCMTRFKYLLQFKLYKGDIIDQELKRSKK